MTKKDNCCKPSKMNKKCESENKKKLMQKLREAIRNDPIRYEEAKKKERERYHERKRLGKIKSVNEMSSREQRNIRKNWRQRSKKYYSSKKNQEMDQMQTDCTSPPSPQPGPSEKKDNQSHRLILGKKKRRSNQHAFKNKIKSLEERLKKVEKKAEKYKKRLQRSQNRKKETPRKSVARLLKGQRVTPEVKEKLLFHEVITKQVRENAAKHRKPQTIIASICGKIIKKYRYLGYMGNIFERRICIRGRKRTCAKEAMRKASECVRDFLEKDESSRLCPGKKDTVTRNKCKKQRRLLSNSLLELYKQFLSENAHLQLSYSSFCKLRPFWILPPNVKDRNTCLCSIHENISLLTSKLSQQSIIMERTPDDICRSLCCENVNEKCLMRLCNLCKDKTITPIGTFDGDEPMVYEEWVTKKVNVIIKGQKKKCQRVQKEEVKSSKINGFLKLESHIDKFMVHVCNVKHQQATIAAIKRNLTSEDVLIHIDFSENYTCKYSSEIQSVHFGGSKPQITLHTVVVYYNCPESSLMKSKCYCTLFRSLRHDPSAICAHLEPIIEQVKVIVPSVKNVHILSDAPATQYRNRKMFFLMGTHLTNVLKCETFNWHYSESGHGKGAPDGVGGLS
ncbi:uncharacterized protein LOC134539299 [Bacillus rossius redtenbacheri]|uniref:uncharacterized protein LOC134539299 n=1 Tax=Bacillus rossius redtenbacheri TaxID=93214 RepID=UPI002FDE62FB